MSRIISSKFLSGMAVIAASVAWADFGPLSPSAVPYEREYIWPEGKMPDVQSHQIAAKTGETKAPGFSPDAFRRPYIEWYAPNPERKIDLCVITVSGGGFYTCCDAERLQPAIDRFVAAGITVADVTYRTPRPNGLPIHQSAWEDLQRAVRVVRSQAAKRGFSPEKIGATGISAGAKAVLLVATSSLTPAYAPVDEIDALPCNLLFAIPQAPAYVLTDGNGTPNSRDGDASDVALLPELKFDEKTCPMCFFQGGIDEYSPFDSTRIYRRLRQMKIPAELHLFADRWHGFHGNMNKGDDATGWDHWFHRAEEFIRQMNYDGRLGESVKLMSRFADDNARGAYEKEYLWPADKMPTGCTNQCLPYVEWHFPKELKTKAIQIIFSGGGYHWNKPEGMEVAPARRYLNGKGMTVVTLKYREPRPAGGLAKHTSAWQDLQRAIRIVRSKAAAKGLDPDRIGIMGGSAGGHLALMGATSSRRKSYLPIDDIDKVPCNVQWAVAIYPAYALTDGVDCKNTNFGNGDDDRLVSDFSFDLDTCPVLFIHGDADVYSPMASVKAWEQLRRMGVQGELHTLATRGHCFQDKAAPETGSYTYIDRIWEFMNHKGFNADVRSGTTLLDGKGIRLAFDTAEKGYNCIGVENRVNPDAVAFCGAEPGRAAFWSLTFWKDGSPTNALTIDNLASCERKVERRGDALVFDWRGLSLGDEHGVVDVRTKVSLSQDGTAAEWRIAVKNRSKRWGLAETTYPLLRNVVKSKEADVLIPKGNWAGRLVKSYQGGPQVGGSSLRYPTSLGVQVQTCAYMVGGAGLQITSLDGRGQVKYFDMPEFDFGIRYACPDEGVPGAANAPGFAVETAAFSGDWWTAAKRYRAWATRQKWAAKGPLATRADFNRQLGDVGYWMKTDWKTATPQLVTNLMARAMAELPGIPLGLHWYCWQQCPFDNNYPEMLPERPGMKEAVAWMKEKGILVMPYINGRLWDDVLESYSNAVPSAAKDTDGKCHIDEYGGHKFAVMCPTTKTWQMKMDELCDTMENELGVNALYLDQVSASMPAPCYDRSHGHPLGGGSHWTEGYRELMKPIREKAFKRGVALTSENAAEPYMDSFDAHLTWFGHSFDDVPMLPAIYSGYTVYFSSVSDKKDSLDSFCAQQGRDFIFGCQIGWNDPWILDDEHREHLKFVERLSRERIAHKEFFLTGELMGELPTPPDMPTVGVQWNRIGMYYSSTPFKTPAVIGAEWRDNKGERRYIVLVNISGDTQSFTYGEGASRKTVTLPPRSVVGDVECAPRQ